MTTRHSTPPWLERLHWWLRRATVAMLMVLLISLTTVGVLIYLVTSSTPYRESMLEVRLHPAVIARLGTPIDTGWLISGRHRSENGVFILDIAVPVTGPKGAGTVFLEASKQDESWVVDRIIVEVKNQKEMMNLAPPESTSNQ